MTKRILWITFGILAMGIGLYPLIYFFVGSDFGLLNTKTNELLTATHWRIGFYAHITFGGMALLTGWTQFSQRLRDRNLHLHRTLGKIYVSAVTLGGIAGFYIAWFATGGVIASAGFLMLALIWLCSTWMAYLSIRRKEINRHQRWMIISYAMCFAAVTLRIWLPTLTPVFGDFISAYRFIAWWCWVPNLIVAILIIRTKKI